MEEHTLSQLKQRIQGLQRDRDDLTGEVLKERQSLLNLEKQIANLKMEYEFQNNTVKEKETVINEYNRMIDESEKAYSKLVENSSKLLRALESESTSLKGRIKSKF
mmetsp:Transcript_38386/g.44714  ORF Transcript_38386/g.44714 Transcript_38386/m.44714 type:complete len:106 (+) Transcript_38386:23-340(+)